MVSLEQPWFLLLLVPVLAVAGWALWRPTRRVHVLPSLTGWAGPGKTARNGRARRRVTASWLLLLAGAVLASLCFSRPSIHTARSTRRIELAVLPSAELAGPEGRTTLRRAGAALADRLGTADRARLSLPPAFGGRPGRWLTASELPAALADLPILPVSARTLSLPPAGDGWRVVFAPVGADVSAGPGQSVVFLPTSLPTLLLERFAARLDGEETVLLARFRNDGEDPAEVELAWRTFDGERFAEETDRMTIPPGAMRRVLHTVPAASAVGVTMRTGSAPPQSAWRVRRPARRLGVIQLGPPSRLLRRYVAADPLLREVDRLEEADVAIARRVRPPDKVPCLVIAPPTAPPGFRKGPPRADVRFADAAAAVDDPVLRDVEPAALAARRVRGFSAVGNDALAVLLESAGEAVLVRTRPDVSPVPGGLRQVWLAWDLSDPNLAPTDAAVVLLANAVRWLGGVTDAEDAYRAVSPLRSAGWQGGSSLTTETSDGTLPHPGLYRDVAGRLYAVAEPAVQPGTPAVDPAQAVAHLPLPPPRRFGNRWPIGSALLVLAGLCWSVGWALRVGLSHTIRTGQNQAAQVRSHHG